MSAADVVIASYTGFPTTRLSVQAPLAIHTFLRHTLILTATRSENSPRTELSRSLWLFTGTAKMFPFDRTPNANPPAGPPFKQTRTRGKLRAIPLRRHQSEDDTISESGPSSMVHADDGDFPTGSRVITRSASSPTLSLESQRVFYNHVTFSNAHSLRLDARFNTDDAGFVPMIKQLSPIAEQEYFSPEVHNLPLPVEDVTPSPISTSNGSQHSGPIRTSSAYSTFISRPLNRSISQTSSRTHMSSSSAVPPIIPPLDFRPTFPGQISVPSIRVPKPAVVRTMSTIPGSSEEVFDDHSSHRADSFKTAESEPATESDIQLESRPASRNSGSQRNQPRSQVELVDERPANSRASQGSSFTARFERRWRRSECYGSGFVVGICPRISATPACWLFWAGFVAPWCWMIGGWYYTIRGPATPPPSKDGKRELLLPMWVTEKRGYEGGRATEKDAVSRGPCLGYPFVDPPGTDKNGSKTSVSSRSPPTIREKKPRVLDPWIFRCRTAAITSGVVIIMAFVIAFVVVGHISG